MATYTSKKAYMYGTGRRKSSVARVHLFPNGTGSITVNGRPLDDYFGLETLKLIVRQPFAATDTMGKFDVEATVTGGGGIFCEIDPTTGVIITDGLDEHGNSYILHPMTGVRFRGTPIPQWEEICDFCRSAAQTLPCLRVVGWDVAILPGGKLELIEGNHNPGMNIVQAPAKHGVHDKFAHMLLDFYGDPAQYAYETVKQP